MAQKLTQTRLKIFTGIIVAILVAGYGILQARDLIVGPKISNIFPENGAELTSALINISGNAKNITAITLNGKMIKTDPNGNFLEPLLLSPGYNIISIKAEDRFKRSAEKQIQLMYQKNGV